jgi:thiol:disulfide interchange protein DsbC
MTKTIITVSILGTFAFANLQNETVLIEQKIKSILPNAPISKIEMSEIKSIYKVYFPNGKILYVAPDEKLIVAGEIFKPNGDSLTQKDQEKWQNELEAKQVENLTSIKLIGDSLKIDFGTGAKKYEFVIFTDPECPYCKKVESEFENKNATLYYNFMPLDFHKNATRWSLDILSSKNSKQTILDIKNGKSPKIEHTKDSQIRLDKMIAKAKSLNISGTPKLFIIEKSTNKVVDTINGADMSKIRKYLSEE